MCCEWMRIASGFQSQKKKGLSYRPDETVLSGSAKHRPFFNVDSGSHPSPATTSPLHIAFCGRCMNKKQCI